MGKMPFITFYVHDWLYDTRICTDQEKAVLIDLLCFMHNAPERGILIGHPQDLARIVGKEWGEFKVIVDSLKRKNIFDITESNGNLTLTSRRMVRDENDRKSGRKRAKDHYEKVNSPQPNANLTPKNTEYRRHINPIVPFETFYSLYPKKQARADAEKAWLGLKASLEFWEKTIRPALLAQRESEQWVKEGGAYIPLPATWIRRKRWEDEIKPAYFETGENNWQQTKLTATS